MLVTTDNNLFVWFLFEINFTPLSGIINSKRSSIIVRSFTRQLEFKPRWLFYITTRVKLLYKNFTQTNFTTLEFSNFLFHSKSLTSFQKDLINSKFIHMIQIVQKMKANAGNARCTGCKEIIIAKFIFCKYILCGANSIH